MFDPRRFWSAVLCVSPLVGLLSSAACRAAEPARTPPRPVVEVEEEVYKYEPANNGAGPMWCRGSTCLVRVGDDVFANGLETVKGVPPMNNCRWVLFHRGKGGWERAFEDRTGLTREPCPLAAFPDGRVFVSVNPALTTRPQPKSNPARPEIFQFAAADPTKPAKQLVPHWSGQPAFTEHSYRSFVADAANQELLLFQNVDYTHAEWAFRDRFGKWTASGRLVWPWGADYAKPKPIRVCYPAVALKDRAAYFLGVSDVVEPNPEWRAYKKQLTGRDWDYDFRRLFYTWTPDIRKGQFRPWVEVASREKTCGWVTPCDLWATPDGAVHLLWTERAINERLRDKFFPSAEQAYELNYAVVRNGQVASRLTLQRCGPVGEAPHFARFQVTPDDRLFVFSYVRGTGKDGQRVSENRLQEIFRDGTAGAAVRVPLKAPFTNFFTATGRAGSAPSRTLELLGQRAGGGMAISYARIRLW
jgi:hypothetical protein